MGLSSRGSERDQRIEGAEMMPNEEWGARGELTSLLLFNRLIFVEVLAELMGAALLGW